jgi:flagellar L-ring protein precursor FlgH
MLHKLIITLLLAACCCASAAAGPKKFSENINRSLFSDRRAYQVGDVVTILIVEHAVGSNESGTNTDVDNQMGLSAVGTGDLSSTNMGLNGQWKHKSDGTGATSRSGTLQGTLSAKIMEITPTGNLVIEGSRSVIINGEKQVTMLKGTVRAEDISGQNTVYSYNVADALISYTGKGDVNSASKPGYFTRMLNWLF